MSGPEAQANLIAVRPIAPPRPTLVVAGCDPALPLLETPLALLDPPVAFAWWPCGNGEALRLAAAGLVHAAGVHQPGTARGGDGHFGDPDQIPADAEVVGFTSWREGLVVRPETRITGLDDAVRQGLRIVNREPGAQARTLLDREVARFGLDPARLPGYDSQAAGHLQVAASVAGHLADVGVSSEPAALAYGLTCIPLAEERFDLVLPAKHASSREVQGLLKVLTSPWLLAQLASLPGYEAASCGERCAQKTVSRSETVDRDEHGPGDGVEAKVEAGHRGRYLVVDVQGLHVERVHREHVAVRWVPLRRCGPAEILDAVIVADAERPFGQASSVGASRAGLQLGH